MNLILIGIFSALIYKASSSHAINTTIGNMKLILIGIFYSFIYKARPAYDLGTILGGRELIPKLKKPHIFMSTSSFKSEN